MGQIRRDSWFLSAFPGDGLRRSLLADLLVATKLSIDYSFKWDGHVIAHNTFYAVMSWLWCRALILFNLIYLLMQFNSSDTITLILLFYIIIIIIYYFPIVFRLNFYHDRFFTLNFMYFLITFPHLFSVMSI